MKKKLLEKLNNKIQIAIRFIDEVLYTRNDVNKPLLEEFKEIIFDYQKSEGINKLKKLREIESKPAIEGASTDYTTGISLPLDGKYISLRDLINEIEDLVFEIEKTTQQ